MMVSCVFLPTLEGPVLEAQCLLDLQLAAHPLVFVFVNYALYWLNNSSLRYFIDVGNRFLDS